MPDPLDACERKASIKKENARAECAGLYIRIDRSLRLFSAILLFIDVV